MKISDVDILLVEDSRDDLDLTIIALRETKIAREIATASDGEEALDFLFCKNQYAGRNPAEQPRLILLDLKIPKIEGIEVLKRIKNDPRTQHIPVVVLTSSTRKADLEASYKAGANSYLVKSVDFDRFTREIKQVGEYWLSLNRASR